MDQVRSRTSYELIYCRPEIENNNNRMSQYIRANSRRDDPLRDPEVAVNLNEGTAVSSFYSLEEPEEDMFDYETDISSQEGTDSEEQVVPSSQLSNSYKYSEDAFISDSEPDEGIEDDPFEDYHSSYNTDLINNSNRHDPQPPWMDRQL